MMKNHTFGNAMWVGRWLWIPVIVIIVLILRPLFLFGAPSAETATSVAGTVAVPGSDVGSDGDEDIGTDPGSDGDQAADDPPRPRDPDAVVLELGDPEPAHPEPGDERPSKNDAADEPDPARDGEPPPARTEYMGRTIARTMHWRGADWLLRATRENEEEAGRMLAALGVEPGDVVCDFGCGNGYHTLRLARMVGEAGTVYAVDVQEQMLGLLTGRLRARREDPDAEPVPDVVRTVLAEYHDPHLPPSSCDVVLMVDVYHELGHPVRVLDGVREALRPGGRLVLVEFRAEDPAVPIKPLHKMSKQQIRREMEANGFRHEASFDDLPWQHMEIYTVAAGNGGAAGGGTGAGEAGAGGAEHRGSGGDGPMRRR